MRVFVTGGAGFIGSHTVRRLRAGGHDVVVYDDLSAGRRERLDGLGAPLVVGSVTDRDAVQAAIGGCDAVLHLAARVSVPASWADPADFEAVNVGGFRVVLEAARQAGVRRVVVASSCAVYGSLPGLPKREGDALAPESPYAASKLANEAYASAWSRAGGLEVVALRYFNVFGPGQDPAGPYGAVVPRFVQAALRGEALEVHGDGEQGRDFVAVTDVAAANEAALTAPGVGGRVFNVGGGRMQTINGLAELVGRTVGRPVQRVYGPARPGDVRFSQADVRAAAEALGWAPQADADRALAETVAWFRDGGG